MWILLTGVLMCYFIGFVLYCCYNTRSTHPVGDDVDNPSGSPVTRISNSSGDEERRSRLPPEFHQLLPLTSCLYDEITQRNSDLPQQTQPNNIPQQQSALLTAHREQQLRQIKSEINALSCRLGIGQIYRDRHYNNHYSRHLSSGMMMSTRHIFVQPRYMSRLGVGGNGRTRLQSSTIRRVGSGDTMLMEEEWDEEDDRSPEESSSLEMSFLSSMSPTIPSSRGETPLPRGDQSQRHHFIYSERERRLQLIRMEIEDLTLQLSSMSEVDQSGASENNAGGCSISSSELEGLGFEPASDSDEETEGLMTNSYSISMSTHDLPSYDESIVLDMDESPPPSYAQCTTHLY